MLEHYLSLATKAIFVENMALAFFLGMCSFLAVSRKVETAFGLGLAVVFVLAITCPLNQFLYANVLEEGALSWLPGGGETSPTSVRSSRYASASPPCARAMRAPQRSEASSPSGCLWFDSALTTTNASILPAAASESTPRVVQQTLQGHPAVVDQPTRIAALDLKQLGHLVQLEAVHVPQQHGAAVKFR